MRSRQKKGTRAGAVTAEFSVALVLFLTIAFGVMELARAMYLYNTLQLVTQRAATLAANVDVRDTAAVRSVCQQAIFRTSPGGLILGSPITDAHVRIDYLALPNAGTVAMTVIPPASLPSCPANNRITCTKDPYDASCVRLVRARICDPAVTDSCNRVPYQTLFSLITLPLTLPAATTIVPAETLGAAAGAVPCP